MKGVAQSTESPRTAPSFSHNDVVVDVVVVHGGRQSPREQEHGQGDTYHKVQANGVAKTSRLFFGIVGMKEEALFDRAEALGAIRSG